MKTEKRPGSMVLEKRKSQQMRQAMPGSVRVKGIEVKLSQSMLDINQALVSRQSVPKIKFMRRFSEPANLATYTHTPINPLVLPKKFSAPLRPKLEPVMKKARSFSLYVSSLSA